MIKLLTWFKSATSLRIWQSIQCDTFHTWPQYLQWEGDGIVAVARQEVGQDGLHGGFLLHLAVSGAQQVSVKYIWQQANTEFMKQSLD